MLDQTPTQPVDTHSPAATQPREYRFRFTGSGGEYFSIWIVNLLLSILTLGIYSAWAKVRREQYFHRNTLLDNQPFDYTGQPKKILIGRILALIVLAVGSSLQKINVPLALAVTASFALLYPWIIVRSLKFRARNTRYRNLALRFTGTTAEAVKVFLWIYVAVVPFVLVSIIYGPELAAIKAHKQAAAPNISSGPMLWVFISMGITALLFAVLWPIYQCRMQAFLHRHLRYGNAQGDFDGSTGDFYRALLRAAGVSVVTIILMGVIIAAMAALKFPWGILLAYPLLLIPQAAYKVNIINTTYKHSSIGEQYFYADMKVGSYAWLLISNLVLLLVTLGFAWPWINVRLARYRCEHLALIATPAAIENVVGEAQQDISAFGEEAAEFLDFDISL
ncbi:MAG TPA: YjgN family protein [Spongiibacteraceae bacterium]